MLSLSGAQGLSRESGGKTAALQKRGCADLVWAASTIG